MASDLFRAPDNRSGPALAGREPIILPNIRKDAASKVQDAINR